MMEKLFSLLNKIPHDKALHTLSGGLVFALCHLMLSFITTLQMAALVAIVFVFLMAVAKELYDGRHPDIHTQDKYDALATTCGGLIVLLGVLPGLYRFPYSI